MMIVNFRSYVENKETTYVEDALQHLCEAIVYYKLDFDEVWQEAVLPVLESANFTTEYKMLDEIFGSVKQWLANRKKQAADAQAVNSGVGGSDTHDLDFDAPTPKKKLAKEQPWGMNPPKWLRQMGLQPEEVSQMNVWYRKNYGKDLSPETSQKELSPLLQRMGKAKQPGMTPAAPTKQPGVASGGVAAPPMPPPPGKPAGKQKKQLTGNQEQQLQQYRAAMQDVQQRFQQAFKQFHDTVRDDAHRQNNPYLYAILKHFQGKVAQAGKDAFNNVRVNFNKRSPMQDQFYGASRDAFNQRQQAVQQQATGNMSVAGPTQDMLGGQLIATPKQDLLGSYTASNIPANMPPEMPANVPQQMPAQETPPAPQQLGGFATRHPGKVKYNNLQGEARKYRYYPVQ